MIRVFSAPIPATAHIVRGALEAEGIAAEVRALLGGGVPIDTSFAEVWVPDGEVGRALRVVERLVSRSREGGLSLVPEANVGGEVSAVEGPTVVTGGPDALEPEREGRAPWRCPRCKEECPPTFELCWACGADRPEGP